MVSSDVSRSGQPTNDNDERTRRKERILDAAAALLVRLGYRKTTIDDVAREAGVGKGTIYLHWPDKITLFNAVIWNESERATRDMLARMSADPEGGLFHRMWAHGMMAVFSNALLSALLKNDHDIYYGFMSSLDPELRERLLGNTTEHLVKLQQAHLIRSDLSPKLLTFLIASLKVGLLYAQESLGPDGTPPDDELTEGLSDIMRRWLQPQDGPGDSILGKQIITDLMNTTFEIERQYP